MIYFREASNKNRNKQDEHNQEEMRKKMEKDVIDRLNGKIYSSKASSIVLKNSNPYDDAVVTDFRNKNDLSKAKNPREGAKSELRKEKDKIKYWTPTSSKRLSKISKDNKNSEEIRENAKEIILRWETSDLKSSQINSVKKEANLNCESESEIKS